MAAERITVSVPDLGDFKDVEVIDVMVSAGAEIAASIMEGAFLSLEAPVRRVAAYDVPFVGFAREKAHVPDVGRVLARPMRIGAWDLPAGVAVTPCIHLTHHRPDVWPEPAQFRPERFLGGHVDPYAFLPFGGGPRRCLGMAFALYEMKMVLAEVLLRVALRPLPGYEPRLVRRSVTVAPSQGMPLVVERHAA